MLKDCRDQVSLVVGGASGMGRLAAQRWADAGGVVNVSLAILPLMLARRRGELVNFGSIAG